MQRRLLLENVREEFHPSEGVTLTLRGPASDHKSVGLVSAVVANIWGDRSDRD